MSSVHTVREGDTLRGIARQHGIPLTTLTELNPEIDNPDRIYPGQTVQLPESGGGLSDSRSPGGISQPAPCEDEAGEITLLPLRYALVEPCEIAGARIRSPYPELGTRPIGVRLARDGYIYVVEEQPSADGQPPRLHEFRLEAMTLTRLLDGVETVTEDCREEEQDTPYLTFGSTCRLHVAYATAPWSADRCNRMLADHRERGRRMQPVDLAGAISGNARRHPASVEPLLTGDRLRAAVAELRDPPESGTPESPVEAERTAYPWTAPPPSPPATDTLETSEDSTPATPGEGDQAIPTGPAPARFEHTTLDDILRVSAPEDVEDDRLFGLVLRDDLGLLQELADYQDHVAGWLDTWTQEHETRYVVGGFIESLFLLDEEAFIDDPRFRELEEDTTEEQRRAILDYLNTLEHESGGFIESTRQAFGSLEGVVQALNPFADPSHRQVARARNEMSAALGAELWQRHQPVIDEKRDTLRARLQGQGIGAQGLLDLVDRPAMGEFLETHRGHLQRWHDLLDRITADRVELITTNHFHEAAWYFDPDHDDQLQQALYTEYLCLRDICRTDEATEAIAAWLDAQPQWTEPLFQTLHAEDQRRAARELEELVGLTRVTVGTTQAPETVENFQHLALRLQGISQAYNLPGTSEFGAAARSMDELRRATFFPAKALGLARARDQVLQRFQAGGDLDLGDIMRRIPGSAWLDMVRGFAEHGATVDLPTERHARRFSADVDRALALRAHLRQLNRSLKQEGERHRRGYINAAVYRETTRDLRRDRENIRTRLLEVEHRLSAAINPLETTDNRAGLQLRGLDAEAHREIRRMADDARAGRALQIRAGAGSVLRSDGLAVIIAVLQLRNLGGAITEFRASEGSNLRDLQPLIGSLFGAAAPTFAAAQGIAITLLAAQLPRVRSQMAQGAVAARLGWLTGHLGTGAYILGFLASLSETGRSLRRWGEALQQGDGQALAGATLSLAGSSGLTATQGWAAWRSGGLALDAYRAGGGAAAWATRSAAFVSIFWRANLLGLLFTAIQLGGLAWYRRHQRDALDTWLEQSAWGGNNAALDLETHQRRWADAVVEPFLVLRKVDHGPELEAELELVLPDLDPQDLAAGAVQLAALRKAPGQWWHPWSQPLAEQLEQPSSEEATLRLRLFPEELNAQTGLALRLTYPSALAPGLERKVQFQLNTLSPHGVPTATEVASGRRSAPPEGRIIAPMPMAVWVVDAPPTVPLQPGTEA